MSAGWRRLDSQARGWPPDLLANRQHSGDRYQQKAHACKACQPARQGFTHKLRAGHQIRLQADSIQETEPSRKQMAVRVCNQCELAGKGKWKLCLIKHARQVMSGCTLRAVTCAPPLHSVSEPQALLPGSTGRSCVQHHAPDTDNHQEQRLAEIPLMNHLNHGTALTVALPPHRNRDVMHRETLASGHPIQ